MLKDLSKDVFGILIQPKNIEIPTNKLNLRLGSILYCVLHIDAIKEFGGRDGGGRALKHQDLNELMLSSIAYESPFPMERCEGKIMRKG